MPAKKPTREKMPLYLFFVLLTLFSACGLLGGNDSGGLLQVTPISAVEVALEIQAPKGADITVERDGHPRYSFRMNHTDTVLYETNLEPATSYHWKATSSVGRGQTTQQHATTLDTTSSSFTWQTFSFGEHSSSVLYGVSIIDENNIWGVGEIYINDSTGQADSDIYNAIHWDGSEWELKRIKVNFRGNEIIPPLEGIHAFSGSDIWVAGSLPIHGDGENWNIYDIRSTVDESLSLWEVWGAESNDVYAAGRNGSMAHWNGEDWQKIETNTELDFYDIHGNSEQGVVAVAAEQSKGSEKTILRIEKDYTTEALPIDPIPSSISGIWFDQKGITYVVGSRISLKSKIDSSVPWRILDKERIGHPYLFAIDANGLNDIAAAGGFGEMVHFNGAAWTLYEQGITGNLYDLAIKEHTVASVGYDDRKAFIIIGKRVNQ